MSPLLFPRIVLFLAAGVMGQSLFGQTLACNAAAQPPLIRSEGLAERSGDIVLTCSGGAPNAQITGNLTIFASVNITNRLGANGIAGLVFTADNGTGPQMIATPGSLSAPGTLVYNGVSFTLSPTGTTTLRISNLRVNASQETAFANPQIGVLLSFSSSATSVSFSSTQVIVGDAQRGLYDAFSSRIICAQSGSPLATNPASFASFIAAKSVYNSTRVTEGFAAAFDPLSGFQGLNADTGTRFIVNYSGFPAGARIFVPTVVAGSDTTQPTSGGDLGIPASGGKYTPNATNGSLLLSLVQFPNSDGSGGIKMYTPGAPGSGTASFDNVNEISLTNGSGFAVYEVVDANPFIQESAQFPTFLALAPGVVSTPVETSENLSFAPLSTVATATSRDPIPRFEALPVPTDCTLLGDCSASYFPALNVLESSVMLSAQANSAGQAGYVEVQNGSGGVLEWNATVTYQSGSNWLSISPASANNNATIQLIAKPGGLAVGTYQATLTIDAGPIAGARQIPVTFNVTALAAVPTPAITSVLNAATLASGPLTPGSLATVMGTLFDGTGLTVTFDGTPAQILFSNATQINLLVPAALQGKTTSQMVVSANGIPSTPQTVTLAAFAPGIFSNGILNQDYTVNGSSHAAAPGTVIQIFATGLSGTGVITATIGGQAVNQPYYAGPAPGLPGVQQIDLILPSALSGNSVAVTVCGGLTASQVTCSPAVQVVIAQQ